MANSIFFPTANFIFSQTIYRETTMNCLSLFDGISVGYEALKRSEITVTNYFASEIDVYAMHVAKLKSPRYYSHRGH
jgi:hypothetical protein